MRAKALLAGQGRPARRAADGPDLRRRSLARSRSTRPIAGIETADAVLLVGSNIRWEAPLIATRLRKIARKGGKVFAIGPKSISMEVEWLGNDLKLLGKLPKAVTSVRRGERPAMIVGRRACGRRAGAALALVKPLG
jgi:NADH-quinone oxidoreductase subunit G